MNDEFWQLMKLLTTGIVMGMLVTGLLLSPSVTGLPFITKASAQEDEDGKVKQVLLIANENKVKIAPDNALHPGGIEYAAMTFNGTIPAPAMAVDQGDTLNVTIKNEGKTIHSLDFHAGIGPGKVLSGNIHPGETKFVSVVAENPGAWMYHCGADGLNGVWEHIANGMYGVVVVHPEKEKPAKEFYLSFGENFNTADKGLFVGTNGTTGTFDLTKFATEQPDLILTNGMAHKYAPGVGETAKIVLNPNPEIFKVTPGELTRWYVLNPGPNGGVSFHFISGQIDVRDGTNADKTDYGTTLLNDETYWIPPGSASVIESTFPDPGAYVGVDHNMNHVVRGAALVVMADGNATDKDQPPGTAVAPKGSDSAVADWSKRPSYESIIANQSSSATQNATLAFAQEAVSIAAGSSNPSASEFFVPKDISVKAGSTVTWTNDDSTIHTVVEGGPETASSGATPAFDSSIIAPGATFENTFDTAGDFNYYCNLHPFMTGKVTVT
ncbi:MAG TPA: multicopper oxidase domain-containing protein [Nitrososphaeraceae archaeon]|nr:multicopper oxidase domain-containing protein [Nitrososphaeraceae archaeon]